VLLTVRDAAHLLRTTERQVYRWVDEEEIPFQRVRDQVRFNRTELLEWATGKRMDVSVEAFDHADGPPDFAAALRRGGVHDGIVAHDRADAIRRALDKTPSPPSLDRELVSETLVARPPSDAQEGVSLPHVRHPIIAPGADPSVTVCYLAAPVDGVHTLVLVVSPTVRAHLMMLAHLVHALQGPPFRAALERHAGLEELVLAVHP
jgi:PTS system nitrogen regulatory IIA component